MRNLPMSLEEFKVEFTRIFDERSDAFFNKVFGLKARTAEEKDADLMTIKDVAEFFQISRVTLNNWIKKDKILSIKKGNQRLFSRSYIERYKQVNFTYNERLLEYPDKYV